MSTIDEILALLKQGGKYSVQQTLDGGMNGYAFRATHIPLFTQVFLKVCDADPDSKALFQEPQSLIAATKSSASKNLIKLVDADKLGADFILMATEWADGGDLLQQIQKVIGQADAVRIAIDILHGVTVLHSARLVHRDIKPANVLLCREGETDIPKVGDFGSAAAIPEGSSSVSASRHSALYVPTEGWETPSSYGIPSDLYQIGIILDEMVNGALPYDLASYLDRTAAQEMKASSISNLDELGDYERSKLIDSSISRRCSSRKILSMRPARPYQSKSLKRIINKSIAPLASQRFQTSTAFISSLQSLDIPNWRPADEDFEALQWRGWDWRVAGSSSNYVVYRRRSKTAAYRRWGSPYASLVSAFFAVEPFR
ncbi:MAG: protein kinase [Terracidiphilus sp.]